MLSPRSPLEHAHLRNETLQTTVLPEIGANIFDLVHLPSRQNFLCHNPRIEPQTYRVDANFANYWCSGRDDGVPTCETCSHNGEIYPNLDPGETFSCTVRAAPWSSPASLQTLLEGRAIL